MMVKGFVKVTILGINVLNIVKKNLCTSYDHFSGWGALVIRSFRHFYVSLLKLRYPFRMIVKGFVKVTVLGINLFKNLKKKTL
jgi:hypothetical protein